MTFYPSKARQEAFVKRYLNKGVVYVDPYIYDAESSIEAACHSAMLWIADNEIATLAEAWDKCPRGDWLGWMVARMKPNSADVRRWYALLKEPSGATKGEMKEVLEVLCMRDPRDLEDAIDNIAWDLKRNFPRTTNDPRQKAADLIREHIPNPWIPKR